MRILLISLRVTTYFICSLLIATTVGLMSLRIHHQKLLSVQSASMAPTFTPGDALVVNPVKAGYLQVGDIISYQSGQAKAVTISHRLVAVNKHTGWLTTAGDRLDVSDTPFPPSQVIGRATAVAPGLGHVMDMVRTPLGLALLLYLPALAIIGGEVQRLF